MPTSRSNGLSRRERQIMDIIYKRGRATAAEVMEDLPDPPTYSAVRGLLRVLEEKEHLTHKSEGKRYIYMPTKARHSVGRSALRGVVQTFYGGSVEKAVAALLDMGDSSRSEKELERLAELIDEARKEE